MYRSRTKQEGRAESQFYLALRLTETEAAQSCGENQQSRTETEKRSLNCQRESNPLGYHSSQLEDAK